ncbi:transposase domain-containing protein [Streptomyces sp. NPDC005799]|uniref:transposase domain-containing protein n=1 Tax=Streptomyces sp. NPDC005799 TaxID=3154678 RepID=UPI00340C472F
MACGVFAPGHLGALTRYLSFELADDVLDRPGPRGRTRTVPTRVAVYFVLALVLFPGASYGRVWGHPGRSVAAGGAPRGVGDRGRSGLCALAGGTGSVAGVVRGCGRSAGPNPASAALVKGHPGPAHRSPE